MLSLQDLIKRDDATKPAGMDGECAAILQYYEDAGRELTRTRLGQLGAGLTANSRPLEVSLLARIVNRLATIYDRPATRWLSQGGKRMSDTDPRHLQMLGVLDRARVDLAWRLVDQIRACVRQCVVRYYPSDVRRAIDVRVFAPQDVLRAPSPGAPDSIDSDEAFALRLAGETFEIWNREGEYWTCRWVNKTGEPTAMQPGPFAQLGGISPYAQLPVQIVYDSFSGGRAWLQPRQSRRAWVESLNALANDLWSLVFNQAHNTRVHKSRNPNSKLPPESGHSVVLELDLDDEVEDLQPNPKIAESQGVLETLVRLWTLSEDLPAEEFQPGRQVVTGAALKVLDRPLMARREAQIPLAVEDERIAWQKLRSVFNYHAGAWGLPQLAEDTELEADIADLDIPVDGAALQTQLQTSIEMGTLSKIDAIQKERNVPRHKAIQILAQVELDKAQAQEAKASQPANGAQIDGAVNIIEAVAQGRIPRDSGIGAFEELFVIDRTRAEKILGSAGTSSFTPTVEGSTPAPAPTPPKVEPPTP